MPEIKWTDAQKKAIDAKNGTLLISAAAGSGKTAVLVEHIVNRLFDETDPLCPSELLVVTFTNAAAAEMRAKILRRVNRRIGSAPEKRNLLSAMEEMTVCTMDSYCMRLVREHFGECDIAPDFRMLDEGEAAALKQMAVREIIDERYAAGDPAFFKLTALFENGRDDAGLAGGILALSDFASAEALPEEFLRTVAHAFEPQPVKDSEWGKILYGQIRLALEYVEALMTQSLTDAAGEATVYDKCAALLDAERSAAHTLLADLDGLGWDALRDRLTDLLSQFKTTFPRITGYTNHPAKLCCKAKRDEGKETVKNLLTLFQANERENGEDVKTLAPIVGTLIDTVIDYDRRLMEKKREAHSYAFSDVTHFALRLLYDPAAEDRKTPLARSLSQGLRRILIDEYQDTNRAQDTLFRCLSDREENLFLVGDVKQSIYRFRLASPEIFTEKLERYPYYTGKEARAKLILGNNFRSREGITQAVNYIFGAVMSKNAGEIDYNEDEELKYSANYPAHHAPDVSLSLIESPETKEIEAEAAAAAELIERQLRQGLTVRDGDAERPAGYGDFCILLRTVKKNAEIFAEALRKRNIPVYYDSREGFFAAAEIRLALAFLRAIDNPLRDVELLAALLSPVLGFTPERVSQITVAVRAEGQKQPPLYTALTAAAAAGEADCAAACAMLTTYRRLAAIAPCYEVFDTLCDETPLLHAVGAMPGGSLRVANLRALSHAARSFSGREEKSLSAFLRYLEVLEDNGAELKKGGAGAAADCVSICSMHRSKGLEYPFVIIAGMNKRTRFDSGTLYVSAEHGVGLKIRDRKNIRCYDTLSSVALRISGRQKTISEELRIYYVAFTRAKEKLFLLAAMKAPEKTLSQLQQQLGGFETLPPYYVRTCSTPLSWLLPALLRHPAFDAYRAFDAARVPADFPLQVELTKLPETAAESAVSAPAKADPALTQALRRQMTYTYPYAALAAAPAKHTASTLQEEHFSPADFGKKKPQFMYRNRLSPTDIGTATHKFLEYCSFETDALDVAREKRRLTAAGHLQENEAEIVDTVAIGAFFRSSLFSRVLRAEAVYREKQFTVFKAARELDPLLPENCAGEQTVLIGKIDLVFLEKDGAVIVDYKTDRVKDIGELRARYAAQLAVYAEAAEKIFGVPVKEKLLYSLHKRDWLRI